MKMFRCRVCGETYLGADAPDRCPFCGAGQQFMDEAAEYPIGLNGIQPTETEQADLEAAIDLERSNTRFYLGMAERRDNDALRSAYKRLARVEAEHCSLFCKLARMAKPDDLTTPSETTGSWAGDIEESLARETRAVALYEGFAASATSDRLREVFGAIAAVERDHIELDSVAKAHL